MDNHIHRQLHSMHKYVAKTFLFCNAGAMRSRLTGNPLPVFNCIIRRVQFLQVWILLAGFHYCSVAKERTKAEQSTHTIAALVVHISKLKMKTHLHRLITSAQIGRIRSNLAAEPSKMTSPCECDPCKRLNYRAEFCPAGGKHWPTSSDPSYKGPMQALATETHVLREDGPNLVGEHLAPCAFASTTCQNPAQSRAKARMRRHGPCTSKPFVKRHALVVNDMVSKLNGNQLCPIT